MKIIKHFLIPKHKVIYVYDDYTVQEALEKIKPIRFSAIPILDRKGHYVGTLSEGDLLWVYPKERIYLLFERCQNQRSARHRDNEPLDVKANSENSAFSKAIDETLFR